MIIKDIKITNFKSYYVWRNFKLRYFWLFYMGEIYKIIAIAVVVAVLCYYLKSLGSELFVPALVAGGAVLLFYTGAYLSAALGITIDEYIGFAPKNY